MGKITQSRPEDGGGTARRRIHLREIAGGDAEPRAPLGEELRTARVRRGEELTDISSVLRIGKPYLSALEEGRFKDLPGTAYAIGFIRAYAAHLGLDPSDCVQRFKHESGWRPELAVKSVPSPSNHTNWLPSGWALMAVVVAIVLVYGAYQLTRSIGFSPPAPVAPVPARIANLRVAHPLSAQARAARPSTAGVHASAQPYAAAAPTGNNAATPSGPAVSSSDPVVPTGQVLGLHNENVRVILHVRADTHLTVRGHTGTVYLNRVLHPGDAYRVPDVVGLSLTTPDGGAVLLELNGRDMGPAGPAGQAMEALSLDPQDIVDRAGTKRPG